MSTRTARKTLLTHRLGAAAAALLLVPALAACTDDGGVEEDLGVDDGIEEPLGEDLPGADDAAEDDTTAYDGPYGIEFENLIDTYFLEPVILTAEVDEVLTEEAFTITDAEGATVESLLVLHEGDAEVESGAEVRVGGVLEESFVLAEWGGASDTDAEDESWIAVEGNAYVEATDVESLE